MGKAADSPIHWRDEHSGRGDGMSETRREETVGVSWKRPAAVREAWRSQWDPTGVSVSRGHSLTWEQHLQVHRTRKALKVRLEKAD